MPHRRHWGVGRRAPRLLNGSSPETVVADFDGTEFALDGMLDPIPGTTSHDAYNLSLLRPGLHHADGQILDEVCVDVSSIICASGVCCMP